MKNKKTIVILSVSSDIGLDLAKRYLKAGYHVVGTYRSKALIQDLKKEAHCDLFYCDVSDEKSVEVFAKDFKKLNCRWDAFISCVGLPQPLTAFFKTDFNRWNDSVHVNSIEQLRAVHALYPFKRVEGMADVVFFAGPATNGPIRDMSAYAISKIMLIKMCELLDAENPDLNVFIVGPGWTRTKTHQTILNDKEISKEKYDLTIDFLNNKEGTPLKDIYDCIEWLRQEGKGVASGRNFSIVHDAWKEKAAEALAKELRHDPNMYKLRRHRNDFVAQQNVVKEDKRVYLVTP